MLNLNVPAVSLDRLRGMVSGRISDAGIVQGAHAEMTGGDAGTVKLVLGAAVPSLGDTSGEDPSEDAALVGAGYASLPAVHGVGEDSRPAIQARTLRPTCWRCPSARCGGGVAATWR